MSPELERNTSAAPPPLILPFNPLRGCSPWTTVATGSTLDTRPPLACASNSTAAVRGKPTLIPPPETSSRESDSGELAKLTLIFPPEILTLTLPTHRNRIHGWKFRVAESRLACHALRRWSWTHRPAAAEYR